MIQCEIDRLLQLHLEVPNVRVAALVGRNLVYWLRRRVPRTEAEAADAPEWALERVKGGTPAQPKARAAAKRAGPRFSEDSWPKLEGT